MPQRSIPAIFMRGGTSKGLFFKASDLPASKAKKNKIFLEALGSPDIYGRQLNGMGGGVSSLSKAVIIDKSIRADADLDFTFAQISICDAVVDYSASCGNLSAAVGPFAIDTGIIEAPKKNSFIRIFNTNLNHIFHAHVKTANGKFDPFGNFSICGVSGTGSKICLDYLNPGGTVTGSLFPTGNVIDTLFVPNEGSFQVTMIDASSASVFIPSATFELKRDEPISQLEANKKLMATLENIRREAGVAMGISKTPKECPLASPKICLLSKAEEYQTLSNKIINANEAHIAARFVSMGQIHRALPVTGAMSLAAATLIKGTVCNLLSNSNKQEVKISNPSGVLSVSANVDYNNKKWIVRNITAFRTAKTLMTGAIMVSQ